MQTSLAKKFFAVGSVSAMLAASLPLVASAAVHAAGTNVVSNGTVYWINGSGQKQAYTSAGAFLSYGFNSWGNVVAASAEDLALPDGAYVPPMDGSLINDKGTVYLMTNGQRAGFTSAANFTGLGYSFANVIAGDTSFLPSAPLVNTTAMAHPVGTLVNQSGTVYLMTAAGKMGIPSLAVFNSWGYSFSKVVPANSYDAAIGMNSGIMQARAAGQLNPTGVSSPTPSTGSVSVGVASDNPAASTIATGASASFDAAGVDLARFTFNGTGTVTTVTLKRIGVSADATLPNVYLYDGATRLTDSASVTSGSMINFTAAGGLFTVNGPKTITVKADVDGNTAGQTVGIQLVSAMTGSTSVAGTPVSGNIHTIASATLATVALSAATGSGNTDPGNDITVWQGSAAVGTRDVLLTRLALRQIGSIQNTDIKNFKLYVDGVLTSSQASLDSNGYVTFNVSKALTTGTRIIKVTADVTGGSSRTVQMSLRNNTDVGVVDTQYNTGIALTSTTLPFGPNAFTVSEGAITVVKATDSQSANVTIGATDISVGKWTFTAYGEAIKVETLNVGFDVNGTDANNTIRNVRILVNGSQVGSTANVAADANADGTQFNTNFMVNPGTPVTVEVRADMVDATAPDLIANGTTTSIQAALLDVGANNGRRQISLTAVDVPTADVLANALTITSGSLSVSMQATYGNQTVVSPKTAYKIAAFNLVGNSTEVVNINTFEVDFDGTADPSSVLTDLYVKYGNNTTTIKGMVADDDNTWSVSFPIGVNETMPIEVYATINNTLSTDNLNVEFTVTGITAQSGMTLYADSNNSGANQTAKDAGFDGQTITGVAAGNLTATQDASTPDAQIIDDSGTVTTAAFKFASVNDSFTITEVKVSLANSSTVQTVNLQDNGVTVTGGSKPGASSVIFSGLNIPVNANSNKILTVQLVMSPIGVGMGTTGAAVTTTLTEFTARDSSGTSDVSANDAGMARENDPAGNVVYVYKAIPTVTLVTSGMSTTLQNGTNTVARFSVNTNGTGTVAWKQVALTINKTGGATEGGAVDDPELASFTLWDADTNTQITAAQVIASNGTTTTACTENATTCTVRLSVGTDADDNVERQVSGAKTYEVRATVTGTLATGDYVSSSVLRPSAHITSDIYTTANDNTPSFVWSDASAVSHDTGTSDWVNDNLLKNLPTGTFTLTR